MKVDKVTYQKVFPLSPYVNEKIGIEIQVDEGETPEDCLLFAKDTVENWHKKHNPELQLTLSDDQIAEIKVERDNTYNRIASIISDIYSCKELKVLESYRLMVKSSLELQDAYDKQYLKLCAKKIN